MLDLHFGYTPNGLVCKCGRHFGCGEWRPELRAARAARMRDTMPEHMPQAMRDFLKDFEKYHGRVKYNMQVTGVSNGAFLQKGENIVSAVYIDMPVLQHRNQHAEA